MNDNIPQLSVVILCYKAEDLAPVFTAEVQKVLEDEHISFELVLVANYNAHERASDRTPAIVRELAKNDPRIVVVSKEKQGMMGWDMRSGLTAATGQTIAVIDGDGQMPAGDVLKVYTALLESGADMAKTYRVLRYDGLKRKIISWIYNGFLKVLFPRVRVRDANSKPKIFRRQGFDQMTLCADDWFIDAEMIIQASYLGFTIKETPTVFHPNTKRASFVRPRALLEFIYNLMVYRLRHIRGVKRSRP